MTRDDAIRKIDSLLALSTTPGAEGESALRRAHVLMTKHGITDRDLRDRQPEPSLLDLFSGRIYTEEELAEQKRDRRRASARASREREQAKTPEQREAERLTKVRRERGWLLASHYRQWRYDKEKLDALYPGIDWTPDLLHRVMNEAARRDALRDWMDRSIHDWGFDTEPWDDIVEAVTR